MEQFIFFTNAAEILASEYLIHCVQSVDDHAGSRPQEKQDIINTAMNVVTDICQKQQTKGKDYTLAHLEENLACLNDDPDAYKIALFNLWGSVYRQERQLQDKVLHQPEHAERTEAGRELLHQACQLEELYHGINIYIVNCLLESLHDPFRLNPNVTHGPVILQQDSSERRAEHD